MTAKKKIGEQELEVIEKAEESAEAAASETVEKKAMPKKADAPAEAKAEAVAAQEQVFESFEDSQQAPGTGKAVAQAMMTWPAKTKLGADVLTGKYKSLDEVLENGELILEPEIVDAMVPGLMHEVVYIGGSPGKGGGIRRTATKMTARMHKSGRRFKLSALSIVGNGNGIVGIGMASSREHRAALEKSIKTAKLSVIRVRRGCGSWECGCGGEHSIPFKASGKSGSVRVTLLPAPKGVGLVASEESKKILRLAGVHDIWVKTMGQTATRNNLVIAVFNALKNLNQGKGGL